MKKQKRYVIFYVGQFASSIGRYIMPPLLVGGSVYYTKCKDMAWSTNNWEHLQERLHWLRHQKKLAVSFSVLSNLP